MRNTLILLSLLSIAAFADTATQTYTLNAGYNGAPTSVLPSAGVDPRGNSFQSVMVTVADYRDGGAGDVDQIGLCIMRAWTLEKVPLNAIDGGAGTRGNWMRLPAADLYCPDGGVPQPTGYSLNKDLSGLGINRPLFYGSEGVVNDAGATVAHQVYIRANF